MRFFLFIVGGIYYPSNSIVYGWRVSTVGGLVYGWMVKRDSIWLEGSIAEFATAVETYLLIASTAYISCSVTQAALSVNLNRPQILMNLFTCTIIYFIACYLSDLAEDAGNMTPRQNEPDV